MQRAISDPPDAGKSRAPANAAGERSFSQGLRGTWEKSGLRGKLLIVTAAFVLMSEVLIFLPSVSNYRVSWLTERLTAAQLAALASEAFPGGTVPSALRADLLRTAQVRAIASRREGERRLVLPVEGLISIDDVYDLREEPHSPWQTLTLKLGQIKDAIGVFFAANERIIRVVGRVSEDSDDLIEIVLPEAPLKAAMKSYAFNILGLSIIVLALTAAVIYSALSRLFVKPLRRLTGNMLHFADNPEDTSRILEPSGRLDEVGVAERELTAMQQQLSSLLAQKNRLAQLGLAVSKINHDLRNMLANAQLMSDRLVDVPDPTVQRFAPKLIASLDRAIHFCNTSLQYGGANEAAPRRELIRLKPLIAEVFDSQGLSEETPVKAYADLDESLRIDADREHLFRIMSNLVRNAVHAVESADDKKGGEVRVKGRREGRKVIIDIVDTGVGVPLKARENLFKAFQGSTKKGGTGLGLAIASELVQAHGGALALVESGKGAHFRIELPDRTVS